jgi:hypothetical protein
MAFTAADLDQFTGNEHLYWQPLYGPIQFTDGVRYVAEAGPAWWLLDIIATTAYLDPAVHPAWMQVWTLIVTPDKQATLVCMDGDEHVLYRHEPITYTDFPLDTITIWVMDQVMLLPGEY